MPVLSDSRRDPQTGRFLSVDPLAAFGGQDSWSPYAAMGNNPGMMVDPLGLQFQGFQNPPLPSVNMNPMGFSSWALRSMGINFTRTDYGEYFTLSAQLGELEAYMKFVEHVLGSATGDNNKNGDGGLQTNDGGEDKKKDKMKSAEEYDYSQDVIPGKMEEDLDYIMNGDDGNMMSRWLKTIKRDWNAKDNMAVQDISALAELGATIIPGRILLRGTAKLIKYESVIDISKFTQRIRGTGNMMDVKTGYYISPTKGVPHGEGAVWKLFDKNGKRIGTFDKDGRYLRK